MHLCEITIPSFARFELEHTPFYSTKSNTGNYFYKMSCQGKMRSDGFKQVPTTLFSHLCRDSICNKQADMELFCYLRSQSFSALQLMEEKIW